MQEDTIAIRIKLTSPLHISSPRAVEAENATCTVRARSKGRKGGDESITTATATMTIPLVSTKHVNDEQGDGEDAAGGERKGMAVEYFPLIPANTLRGRLRRCAAEHIFKVMREKGEVLSLDAVHVLTCGASSGQPEGGAVLLADRDMQMKDPYFTAFGGGPKILRSGIQIGNALPITRFTVDEGYVPASEDEHATRQLRRSDFFFGLHFRRVDDVLRFGPGMDESLIENYPESVREWMEMIATNKEDRAAVRNNKGKPKEKEQKKEGDDGESAQEAKKEEVKKADLTVFSMRELVVPGTLFYTDIRFLPSMSDAAKGCVVEALKDAIRLPIGGKTAIGCGRFVADVEIAGKPLFTDDGEYSEEAQQWVNAYYEWLSSDELNAEYLNRICKGK